MMTKKSEMAEWILDFFRRSNCRAGQIVMFRNLRNSMTNLNPKEQDLFMAVANELIEHGYFTFEQEPLQCLRLSDKGYQYIYNPEASLDCCVEKRRVTEKDYMAVIELGATITSLEAYKDILERGQLADDLRNLQNLTWHKPAVSPLRIETIKEYYQIVYDNFRRTCEVLSLIDDKDLLDIIDGYITLTLEHLYKDNTIRKAPIIDRLNELYNSAMISLQINNRKDITEHLQQLRGRLFN